MGMEGLEFLNKYINKQQFGFGIYVYYYYFLYSWIFQIFQYKVTF